MLHGWLGQGVNKSLGDQDSAEGCVLGQGQHWYGRTELWGRAQTHIKAVTLAVLAGALWKIPEPQQSDLLVRMLLG